MEPENNKTTVWILWQPSRPRATGAPEGAGGHGPLYVFVRSFNPFKVEKILKGSLDSIQLPSPSLKIQIMGGKVCLRCKDKTLLVVVNKLLKTKSLLISPNNVLPYYLK